MNPELQQIDAFKARLQKLGADYVCNISLPASLASVSFLGPFQGQTVLWNMTLATLKQFRAIKSKQLPESKSELFDRPFIEITQEYEGIFALSVGFDLDVIDVPVIRKSIIMMRNYKRLSIGRIEFGSMHT